MNSVHIHLLLNHFPTIGFCIGLALFVIALLRRSLDLQQAGLVIFFVTAALTIATYVSGNDAQEMIRDSGNFPESLVKAHESAALIAFVFMQATGFFAWLGLWMMRRLSRIANWNLAIVLLLALVTFGLMARAADLGGEIQHTEIQNGPAIPPDADRPTLARSWAVFVENNSWVWPTCETVHFIGLSMLFGVVSNTWFSRFVFGSVSVLLGGEFGTREMAAGGGLRGARRLQRERRAGVARPDGGGHGRDG